MRVGAFHDSSDCVKKNNRHKGRDQLLELCKSLLDFSVVLSVKTVFVTLFTPTAETPSSMVGLHMSCFALARSLLFWWWGSCIWDEYHTRYPPTPPTHPSSIRLINGMSFLRSHERKAHLPPPHHVPSQLLANTTKTLTASRGRNPVFRCNLPCSHYTSFHE